MLRSKRVSVWQSKRAFVKFFFFSCLEFASSELIHDFLMTRIVFTRAANQFLFLIKLIACTVFELSSFGGNILIL